MLPIIGSHCLYDYNKRDGKLWPVLLCDDETPPKLFMSTKPAGNVFPAILLGKHTYIWVAIERLREFDPLKDYLQNIEPHETDQILESDTEEVRAEKARRRGLILDAPLFETPEYWKNYIEQKSQARKLEREMNRRHETKKKRKRATNDDEDDIFNDKHTSRRAHLPTPNSASQISHSDSDDLDTHGESDEQVTTRPKIKSEPFVEDCDDSDEEVEIETISKDSSEKRRAMNLQRVRDDPPGDDRCTIFVGEETTPFAVPKASLDHCDFLANRVAFTEEMRSFIYLDEEVTARDFMPVAEYLSKGEFAPRLIDDRKSPARLERVTLPEEKDKAAIDIAVTYLTAATIQHAQLQSLCVEKLKALYPLTSYGLLVVVQIFTRSSLWDADAESEIREWLVDHVTEFFWKLVYCQGQTLARLMGENEELRQSVLDKLAMDKQAGQRGLEDIDQGLVAQENV